MYIPSHFSETDNEVIQRIITNHALATLITNGANGLDANQTPLELVEMSGQSGILRGHIARANPLWQQVPEGSAVLAIFRASDAYISPNWYPTKHETHRLVPTWNYQVVNVHGKIKFIEDEKFLRAVVGRLTKKHEAAAEGDRAWKMADAPADYLNSMLQAIVGIEIEFDRVDAKSKLSQNREKRDRLAAAEEVNARGQHELAEAMRRL